MSSILPGAKELNMKYTRANPQVSLVPINCDWRCPWCNGYRCRMWTRRHEFKSWTDYIPHCTNTLGKGMNPIILPPAMGK